MKLLVTAGNAQTPIDQVRCLTNIFTGQTGAAIALAACGRGHKVWLLTSQPAALQVSEAFPSWQIALWAQEGVLVCYRTFDELQQAMESLIPDGGFDAIVHTAAVADYYAAGVFAPRRPTHFVAEDLTWRNEETALPTLVDRAAAKVKSDEPELWLRLVRAPKLVDRIRPDWGFRGKLVKFKLEVGISDEQLLTIAEASRRQSQADWMVANTLEGAKAWAYLGPFADGYHKVSRSELPMRSLEAIESI